MASLAARLLVLVTLLAAPIQDPPRHTIAGRVIDSNGRAPAKAEIELRSQDGNSGLWFVPVASDGSFKSPPMPRGRYVLSVGRGPFVHPEPDDEDAFALVEIGSADVAGLAITTRKYALRGKYVMRGSDPAAPWPANLHVTALRVAGAAAGSSGMSEGAPNGEFILRNVFGPCVLRVGYSSSGLRRWSFESVLLDGVDVTDVPVDFSEKPSAKLEVVFTQHLLPTIEGTVTTFDGEPAPGAWIVMLSANPALWQMTTDKFQAGRDGRFSTRARLARYLLAALPATPYQVQPILGDLSVLAGRATPVTVDGREHVDVQLRLPR